MAVTLYVNRVGSQPDKLRPYCLHQADHYQAMLVQNTWLNCLTRNVAEAVGSIIGRIKDVARGIQLHAGS